ncbi:MAG: hypothetical protein CMJ83_15075 [Planctomycetes bacterium]|nr:hypothetical protein [Planctomycetota bacterium]
MTALGRILAAAMLFATAMGSGIGIWIVNPDPADPDATREFLGMPVLFVWGVSWFCVQVVVVVIAYRTVWRKDAT